MKCLMIKENKGFYSLDGNNWIEIDKINKDDIMKMIDAILDEDEIDMDQYDEGKLANQAHKIIYSNIYSKLVELEKNKTMFIDESKLLYRDALEKYKKN